jgi:hypothetical protein
MKKNAFPDSVIKDSMVYGTINYARLLTVEETVYSSVLPYHFSQINKILKHVFKSPKLIIDACAHIGGSTLNIASSFPNAKIISVELITHVFNKLVVNINELDFKNQVCPVNENCISYIKKLKCKPDFINLDPPWGGPGYSKIKNHMLTLDNTAGTSIPIWSFINDIFTRKITRHVTFKAPINFDMGMFIEKVNGNVRRYGIQNAPPNLLTNSKSSKRSCVYYYVIVNR